jgi:hypothetical protein
VVLDAAEKVVQFDGSVRRLRPLSQGVDMCARIMHAS